MGWLDDAEQRAEAAQFSSSPEVLCVVAEDAPRAYALVRQLGEALRDAADWYVEGDFYRSPTRLRDNERIAASRAAVDSALAAFREATEDR
jgi:hypothetical protein